MHLKWYLDAFTLFKIQVLQKVLHSDAIEEPFLVPQRKRNISFLPFYNLKNLLSPQRTFCETEIVLQMLKVLYGTI